MEECGIMSLHRKIIALVALGLLVFTSIVVLSLWRTTGVFSSIAGEMEQTSQETHRIGEIGKAVSVMSAELHRFAADRNTASRALYLEKQEFVLKTLDEIERYGQGAGSSRMAPALRTDITRLADSAAKIFALADPAGRDRNRMYELIVECDSLLDWMRRDMETHFNESQAHQSRRLADYVLYRKEQLTLLFITIVLSTFVFLVAFSIYIRRKLTLPLQSLSKGALEISQGNLEYRIKLRGADDVAQLARRFNDMALQLKNSYAELETKLLDRTRDLAAIDSVALTLSRAVGFRDMLTRSLGRIIENMEHLEPRGGVFMCEPDGGTLRLVAHEGLSPQFIRQEETIRMGECLCGIAAQTGELMHVEYGCSDPRHTRAHDDEAHAHIIIPIKSRGIVLGVIFLYPQKAFSLKPSDLQMLETFGSQIGMAVENLRLYAEVKDSSEKYWDLFENSRDILFTMDARGVLTSVNKAAEIFTGYAKPELIGKSIFDFLTPTGGEAVKEALSGNRSTEKQPIEYEVRKRDGSVAYLEVSARRMATLRTPAGYQISARDITDQKALRRKLLHAERLGAIGEVVITVRHEINNPLTTVIGNIELLLERYQGKDPALTARLETVLNNSLRIAEIVKQLQAIKRDKVVEYVDGISMTDLKQE